MVFRLHFGSATTVVLSLYLPCLMFGYSPCFISFLPAAFLGVGDHVWMVGHSYIFWAQRHPLARRAAVQLGGKVVRWLGLRGGRWKDLLGMMFRQECVWGRPDCVVIHMGGNDLCTVKGIVLIGRIKRDLLRVRAEWPEVCLVWSDVVPRLVWRGSRSLVAIDKARKKLNWAVSRFVVSLAGRAVRHPSLVVGRPELFLPDGVHLSPQGVSIFLQDLFAALR